MVLQHRFSAGVDSGGSRPIQDVDCGIVIAVEDKTAGWTGMNPVRKRLIPPALHKALQLMLV
jgi:hypothetical protein